MSIENEEPKTQTVEGYITKKEVARRVKKTERTVEYWMLRGILPFVKCGKSVLFNWADVVRHLNEHFGVCRAEVVKTGFASTVAGTAGSVERINRKDRKELRERHESTRMNTNHRCTETRSENHETH
jgi:excisionase family DNA binding protein